MRSALPLYCVALKASGFCIDNLISKPKKRTPPEPRWPDGSPYREPQQLNLPFLN